MSQTLEDYVARVVAAAPPLTSGQMDHLSGLVHRQKSAVHPTITRPTPPARQATTVYRQFDACGCLLYIGVAYDAVKRTYAHNSNSWWMPWVARVDMQELTYADRAEAMQAERDAITTERPVFNKVHATDRDRSIVDYFITHERWEYLSVPSNVDALELPQLVKSLHRAGLTKGVRWHKEAQRER